MSYKTSLISVAEGIDIHTLIFRPQVAHEVPSLVLLHFCGGANTTFLLIAEQLCARHTLIIPSLRGWGHSSRHLDRQAYHLGDYASDIVALVDKIKHDEPKLLEHGIVLVGHSMGGKLAQYLLTEPSFSSLVQGLVLLAPAPAGAFSLPAEMKEQQIEAFQNAATARYVVENVLLGSDARTQQTITQQQKDDLVSDIVTASPEAKAAWPSYGMTEDYQREVCDAIRGYVSSHDELRVLVIVGREDRVETTVSVKERTVDVLVAAGANVDMHVVENVGHLLPVEAPVALGLLIDRFLRSKSEQARSDIEQEAEAAA